jgi:uncharacterized protein (TIGR00369 family)
MIYDSDFPATSLKTLQSELQQLQTLFGPDVQSPPNCFLNMKPVYADYESRSSLAVKFPVLNESLNPVGVMQGGFITAAFDNVFGPLSYLAARHPCSTLDLHTQFVRSVKSGDTLTVRATVVSRGPATMLLTAEALNGKGKLVASASANVVIMR